MGQKLSTVSQSNQGLRIELGQQSIPKNYLQCIAKLGSPSFLWILPIQFLFKWGSCCLFPVLQGNGAIKCSRTPAGTASLQAVHRSWFCCTVLLLHSAQGLLIHVLPYTCIFRVAVSINFKSHWLVVVQSCCTVQLHSTAAPKPKPTWNGFPKTGSSVVTMLLHFLLTK